MSDRTPPGQRGRSSVQSAMDYLYGDPRTSEVPEITIGAAYSIATERMFCPMEEFYAAARELLGREVLTHEIPDTLNELKGALESRLNAHMNEALR